MKRNPKIGASCGRIHPTGNGFMQSYQMFEYAVGHWLQKSTEHILGIIKVIYSFVLVGFKNALHGRNLHDFDIYICTKSPHNHL